MRNNRYSVCADMTAEIPYLYRTPEEIRERMYGIATRIRETREHLNARELLMNFLTDHAAERPGDWIAAIEEVVSEARETLAGMEALEDELADLAAELNDARALLARR